MGSRRHFEILIIFLTTLAQAKLITLLTLSRHGSRAPNPVVRNLCPANIKNLYSYEVPFTQLTSVGINQMTQLGKYIRQTYVPNFLSSSLSSSHWVSNKYDDNNSRIAKIPPTAFETYFQADAAPRCAQSAMSMARGLYPDGTGPASSSFQPVAIVQAEPPTEVLFCTPKTSCLGTVTKDLASYASTRGAELLSIHRPLLESLYGVCKVRPDSYNKIPGGEDEILGLKDLADSFLFDIEEGHSDVIPGLNDTMKEELRQLEFTMLMERYYGTDKSITYWSSGFPRRILKNFASSLESYPSMPAVRYYSYHGHRELMYAMAMLLGIPLDFPLQPTALGKSAIPPATTYFFELHETTEHQFEIHTFLWSPQTEAVRVKLSKCSAEPCPFSEFQSIITNHLEKTGTWQDICLSTKNTSTSTYYYHYSLWFSFLVNGLLGFCVLNYLCKTSRTLKCNECGTKARYDEI